MNVMKRVKPKSHLVIGMLLLFGLGGCGGGGGSDEPSGAVAETVSNNADPVAAADLQQLRIDPSNELRLTQTLQLSVEMTSARAYLSVCPDPGASLSVATMDYGQCILRVPLRAGFESLAFDLPNHVDALVAVIWFYENGREPLLRRWQRGPGKGGSIDAIWQIREANG